MFEKLEKYIQNQKDSFIENETFGITEQNISEYYELIKSSEDESWAAIRQVLNNATKLCFLEDEVILNRFNGYFAWTNYRVYLQEDSGLTSIPRSSIIKFYDYKTSNSKEYKNAKQFIKKNNDNGWDIDDYNVVFKSISGGFVTWEYDLVDDKYIQAAINLGDYLDLNEDQTKSIYKKRSSLKKKNSEIEDWNIDTLIEKLFISKTEIKSANNLSEIKSADGNVLEFIIKNITSNIKETSKNYNEIMFAYSKLEEQDFNSAKKEFEQILKSNIKDSYSNLGKDIIKMLSLSVDDLESNNEIIEKYKGDEKNILSILNNHLTLNIAGECYDKGIEFAIKKRKEIQQANQKAAASVLTATTASNFKSKTYRNIGYAAAGGMLVGAGSDRANASQSGSVEVQFLQAGFNICSSISVKITNNKSKLNQEYIDSFFRPKVLNIVNDFHKLICQEFLVFVRWKTTFNYIM